MVMKITTNMIVGILGLVMVIAIVPCHAAAAYTFDYSVTTSGTENIVAYPDVAFSYRVTATGTETYPIYPLMYSQSLCYWCFGSDNWECPGAPAGYHAIAMTRLPFPGSDSDYGCGCDGTLYASFPGCPSWDDDTTAYYCTYEGSIPSGSATQAVTASQTNSGTVNHNEGGKNMGGFSVSPSPDKGGTVSGVSYSVESLTSGVNVRFSDGSTTTGNPASTIVASTNYSTITTVPWGPVTTSYSDEVTSSTWQEIRTLPTAPNPSSSAWIVTENDARVDTRIENGILYGKLLNQPPIVSAGGPYSGSEGLPITFIASASDADGDTLSYYWDFNNDGTWDAGPLNTPGTTNIWQDVYTGTITVGVSDGYSTEKATTTVTVNPFGNQLDYFIMLQPGWNFVSTPRTLDTGNNTALIFRDVNTAAHTIWLYDASGRRWTAMTATTKVRPLEGIWIFSVARTGVLLHFTRNPIQAPPTKQLFQGWNAIGFPDTVPASARATLLSVRNDWTQLMGYDAENQRYEISVINGEHGIHSDSTLMIPTKGYWLYMTRDREFASISW